MCCFACGIPAVVLGYRAERQLELGDVTGAQKGVQVGGFSNIGTQLITKFDVVY